MNISKVKVALKYLTGGIESVIEYILDLFNEMIAKLPFAEVAKYAQLASDVANFVRNCCVLINDEKRRLAAEQTAQCFADLAVALVDGKVTKGEIDALIEQVKAAIKAWKEA